MLPGYDVLVEIILPCVPSPDSAYCLAHSVLGEVFAVFLDVALAPTPAVAVSPAINT